MDYDQKTIKEIVSRLILVSKNGREDYVKIIEITDSQIVIAKDYSK